MLCWMHIYVLGTAVCIHLRACILLFNSGCLEVFSWAHCILLKRMQHIFKRCEFLFYFLLLDVIFISSFISFLFLFWNQLKKKKKQKSCIWLSLWDFCFMTQLLIVVQIAIHFFLFFFCNENAMDLFLCF